MRGAFSPPQREGVYEACVLLQARGPASLQQALGVHVAGLRAQYPLIGEAHFFWQIIYIVPPIYNLRPDNVQV